LFARRWSDEETKDVILGREVGRCWKERGMGDFAVGRCEGVVGDVGRILGGEEEVRIVEGDDYSMLVETDSGFFDAVHWIGYVGVRDATTASMPEPVPGDPQLPPWLEMVKLRYGVAPESWGRAVARGVAEELCSGLLAKEGLRDLLRRRKETM
jgi:hypothetical protein